MGISAGLGGRLNISIGADDEERQVFTRLPAPVVDAIAARPDVATADRSAFVFVSNGIGMGLVGTETTPSPGSACTEGRPIPSGSLLGR